MVLNFTFKNIVAGSFLEAENKNTSRKPATCRESLESLTLHRVHLNMNVI